MGNFNSPKNREENSKIEVRTEWKRVKHRLSTQVSRSDQLNFMAAHWVFMPLLVTCLGQMIEHACLVANGKNPPSKAKYIFLVVVNFNSEIVQLQLKNSSFPSI